MIDFRTKLEDKISTLVTTWVGPSSGITAPVVTFDDHLHDVELNQFPYVVINVRTAEKAEAGEIGNTYDLFMWTIHIYYLDLVATYSTGKTRRDHILSIIEKNLEKNRYLDHLQSTDPDGAREYVYDSSISAILFDSSGQEEYYSFVSELYLNVYTARSN